FEQMVDLFRRPNLVAEGDSWFDYPPRKLVGKKPSNVIDHIEDRTWKKVNLLRMESNGDEVTQILSKKQRHALTKLLRKYQKKGKPIDVLFFSGGGNDVVGKLDMIRFLNPFKQGFSARDCINASHFGNKVRQIRLAFLELIHIRNQFSPGTVIITHNYDIPYVTGKGSKFWGIKFSGPWIKPAMKELGIPENLRRPVIELIMKDLAAGLETLRTAPEARGKFLVAPTLGTLQAESDWENELHPTSDGFDPIAEKVYAELRSVVPGLPNW
ncbi:MAG: hypothetical protein V3R73_03540, partial [Sphingomonadales bacterium]